MHDVVALNVVKPYYSLEVVKAIFAISNHGLDDEIMWSFKREMFDSMEYSYLFHKVGGLRR